MACPYCSVNSDKNRGILLGPNLEQSSSEERDNEAVDACHTIFYSCCFYVSKGKLQGYSSYNLIGRVYLWAVNWLYDGFYEKQAAAKIAEIFAYIIAKKHPQIGFSLPKQKNLMASFSSLQGLRSGIIRHKDLAHKVRQTFPARYLDVHIAAHTLFHQQMQPFTKDGKPLANSDVKDFDYHQTTEVSFAEI